MKRKKALARRRKRRCADPRLAACGGSADDDRAAAAPRATSPRAPARRATRTPTRTAPPPRSRARRPAADHRLRSGPGRRPDQPRPAGLWSVTDNSIAQDLLFRSLTQYRRDPRPARRCWSPTSRPTWARPTRTSPSGRSPSGTASSGRTASRSRLRRSPSASSAPSTRTTSRPVPAPRTRSPTSSAATSTRVPTPTATDFEGVTVEGNDITIKMAKPFPDMDYYGIFPAMGPVPLDAATPPDYGLAPLATGPYKVEKYVPNQELVLVKNDQWDPEHRPGPPPVRRQVHASSSTATTQWPTRPCSATRARPRSSTSMLAQDYTKAEQDGLDSQVLRRPAAVHRPAGCPTTRRSPSSRSGRRSPSPTPTRTPGPRRASCPGSRWPTA